MLDDLRAALPDCGFALYAYEPGGPVTLEVITPDGETFTFAGPTAAAAIARALPRTPEPAAAPADLPDIFD